MKLNKYIIEFTDGIVETFHSTSIFGAVVEATNSRIKAAKYHAINKVIDEYGKEHMVILKIENLNP